MEISVIVPTYNRKALLKYCLDSLLAQTYPKDRYEIIIADDGSNDGTEEVVKGTAKTTVARVGYFKQPNKGPATARNLGIKKATGEIIAFIDDDCIADKEWLNNIMECFNNSVAGVEGKVVSEGKTPFTHQVENLKGNLYLTANIAYKNEVLLGVGLFDEGFPYAGGEDWDLAFKILEKGKKIRFSENAIVTHPSKELGLKEWVRTTWIQWATVAKLYKRHKELWAKTTGHSLIRGFFDGIFLHPFVFGKKWRKYLFANPTKIPKFTIYYLTRSGVIALVGIKSALLAVS